MGILGKLLIVLGLDATGYKTQLKSATRSAQQSAEQMQAAFNKMNFRGAIRSIRSIGYDLGLIRSLVYGSGGFMVIRKAIEKLSEVDAEAAQGANDMKKAWNDMITSGLQAAGPIIKGTIWLLKNLADEINYIKNLGREPWGGIQIPANIRATSLRNIQKQRETQEEAIMREQVKKFHEDWGKIKKEDQMAWAEKWAKGFSPLFTGPMTETGQPMARVRKNILTPVEEFNMKSKMEKIKDNLDDFDDRIELITDSLRTSTEEAFYNMGQNLIGSWDNTMYGLMSGTVKFRDFAKRMFQDVMFSFMGMFTRRAAEGLFGATFGKLTYLGGSTNIPGLNSLMGAGSSAYDARKYRTSSSRYYGG